MNTGTPSSVVPICRALSAHGWQIAARTYHAHKTRAISQRALWDITVTEVLAGIYDPQPAPAGEPARKVPESLYGSRKMWAHLNRHRTHGGPLHGRTDHGSPRLAWGDPSPHSAHHY